MSSERLFLIDPYNEDHLQMLETFEIENNITNKTKSILEKIRLNISKEEYDNINKNSNVINEFLFLEDNSTIKDICHIHYEKDLKTCKISFVPLKNKTRNRHLITLATDFVLNTLNMQVALLLFSKEEKLNLEEKDYEFLGEENGSIIYLKEKEQILKNQRTI